MKEDEPSFLWIFRKLELIYIGFPLPPPYPNTITTDADPAAISALKTVFPTTDHLLCIWHTQKDILAYIKKEFNTLAVQRGLKGTERTEYVNSCTAELQIAWSKVIYSLTEEEFKTCWTTFTTSYSQRYPEIINYLTRQ